MENPFETRNNNRNNNPFETGKNSKRTSYQPSDYTNERPVSEPVKDIKPQPNNSTHVNNNQPNLSNMSNNQQAKRKSEQIVSVIVMIIVVISIGFNLLAGVFDDTSSDEITNIGNYIEIEEGFGLSQFSNENILGELEVVEGYEYQFSDFMPDLATNPFPQQLPQGTNYTLDLNDSRVEYDDNQQLKLEVGVDIEPGVYTIKADGSVLINLDSALDIEFDYDPDVNYYNLPLIEGDTLKITFVTDIDENSPVVTLTAQSAYVDYEPGINGVFVYGLNQFESNLQLNQGAYKRIMYGYHDSIESESYQWEYIFDQDITLPGSPGSYFTIEIGSEQV